MTAASCTFNELIKASLFGQNLEQGNKIYIYIYSDIDYDLVSAFLLSLSLPSFLL